MTDHPKDCRCQWCLGGGGSRSADTISASQRIVHVPRPRHLSYADLGAVVRAYRDGRRLEVLNEVRVFGHVLLPHQRAMVDMVVRLRSPSARFL